MRSGPWKLSVYHSANKGDIEADPEDRRVDRCRDACQRSAIIYSIVISCQRRGVDPLAYLRGVLRRLPTMTTKDDLSALLPVNWQPAA